MELLVDRRYRKPDYTIGYLYVNGAVLCNTLEDTDRGLRKDMSKEEINSRKIYGETAIPSGRYKVEMTYSTKFGAKAWAQMTNGKVPEIVNVPGFAGVRIHPGNDAHSTWGCILPGVNNIKGKVTNSQAKYKSLLVDFILPALEQGEDVYITIR